MNIKISKYLNNLNSNKNDSKLSIEYVEEKLKVKFPDEYKYFLKNYNGARGQIGENSYVILWSLDDLIKFNQGYNVEEFALGLVLIGSDGGDTAYAIDMRYINKPIVQVPFIGMDLEEVILCSETFEGFLEYLYNM